MLNIRSTTMAAICAGLVASAFAGSAQAAAEQPAANAAAQPSAAQQPGGNAESTGAGANASGQAGGMGNAGSSGSSAADCPPEMNQSAKERLEPPGPVGRTGGASAMVDDSGTIGSTGETRATTTSGATGTTADFGSYGADPSGSVTTSGATGAPVSSAVECAPGAADQSSGASAGGQPVDEAGRTPADVSPEQAQPAR